MYYVNNKKESLQFSCLFIYFAFTFVLIHLAHLPNHSNTDHIVLLLSACCLLLAAYWFFLTKSRRVSGRMISPFVCIKGITSQPQDFFTSPAICPRFISGTITFLALLPASSTAFSGKGQRAFNLKRSEEH